MKNINTKKWFCAIIFFPLYGFGQNLVSNPGFEQHSALPVFLSGWSLVNGWNNAGYGITTPDYYHSGSASVAAGLPNSQFARISPFADSAIMGYYAYEKVGNLTYREYIQTRLTSPLIPGTAYRVSMALSNGNTKPPAFGGTNGAGILFSVLPVSQTATGPAYTGPINLSPDWHLPDILWDSGWQKFTFFYLSYDPAEYLTIGNFLPDSATLKYHPSGTIPFSFASYFYVDEVSVVPTLLLSGNDTICQGDTAFLSATLAPSWKWITSDGHNIGNSQTLSVSPATTTTYQVISGTDTARHTVFVIPLQTLDLGSDTILCTGETLTLRAFTPDTRSYLWQDGSDQPELTVGQAGTYYVTVGHACGTLTDTLQISTLEPPRLELGDDETTLCTGEEIILTGVPGIVWENGSRDPIRTIRSGGLFAGEVRNHCGFARDTVRVKMGFSALVNLGNDTTLCPNESLVLDVLQNGEADYLWSDGTQQPFLQIGTPGIFSVRVTTECGTWRDEILVNYLTPPQINLGKDTTLCTDRAESFTLYAYQPFARYRWQDGSDKPYFEVKKAGLYRVEISNECGITTDEIQVEEELCDCHVFFPNAFTPNDDAVNETFGAVYSCEISSWQMTIYDRWGKLLASAENPDYQWDGKFRGKECPEGVYVWKLRYNRKNEPIIEKGGTITLIR